MKNCPFCYDNIKDRVVVEKNSVVAISQHKDFMFQLTQEEFINLKSQIMTSSWIKIWARAMMTRKEVKDVSITIKQISGKIYFIRGYKIMLDRDLAGLYGVETKALKQAS